MIKEWVCCKCKRKLNSKDLIITNSKIDFNDPKRSVKSSCCGSRIKQND